MSVYVLNMEELLIVVREAWESVSGFLKCERVARGDLKRRTHHAWIVCDVFTQLLFPGEGFLIWYDIPDEYAATAAQKVCGLRIYQLVRHIPCECRQDLSDMMSSTASEACAKPLICKPWEKANIPSVSS